MTTLIIFLLVLSVLVFVHEFGHFWSARKLGVKAEEFGFGLPPRVFGIYRKNGKWKHVWWNKEVKDVPGTVYSFNWIPIGGFVKIKGQDGEENVKISESEGLSDKDSYATRPIWQRFIIISAGVSMNVFLAVLLISFGLMIGFPMALDGLDDNVSVSDKKIQIAQVLKDTPAQEAGLKMADVILSVDGNKFESDEGLQNYVADRGDKELEYEILRGDEVIKKNITPEFREDTGKAGIGVAILMTGLVKYPVHLAIWNGIKSTILLTVSIIFAFIYLIKDLIMGHGMPAEIAGPVGIATMTGQFAEMGIRYLLQFSALLSINLAVLNFLPFPALDGGHALFLLIEKIKGSPVRKELANAIHGAGMVLLMLLVLAVTFKDVINIWK